MAAECARDALLQRTMDNKENTGDCFLYCGYISTFEIALPYIDLSSCPVDQFLRVHSKYIFLNMKMHFPFFYLLPAAC